MGGIVIGRAIKQNVMRSKGGWLGWGFINLGKSQANWLRPGIIAKSEEVGSVLSKATDIYTPQVVQVMFT